MRQYKQQPPYSVQIELTEGCTLACSFCGINGIREKPGGFKFMSKDTIEHLAKLLSNAAAADGWNPRLEFAMHGEPTMHRNLCEFILTIRHAMPRSYMLLLTNGSGLSSGNVTDKVDTVMDSGLNTLGIERYSWSKFWKPILSEYKGFYPVRRYPEERDANPHKRHKGQFIVFIQDIAEASKGTHSKLTTHCGTGLPPVQDPLLQRCARPFRELSIRWDGSVALCCNDWRGHYRCGNINRVNSLEAIWNGKAFDAARRELYRGNRHMLPNVCAKCDERTYRNGLLPDGNGLFEMTKPSAASREVLKNSMSKPPLTEPVKREWE